MKMNRDLVWNLHSDKHDHKQSTMRIDVRFGHARVERVVFTVVPQAHHRVTSSLSLIRPSTPQPRPPRLVPLSAGA
jgi:hypothetical protein